ncbi:MAG: putative negative regulator of RcsB-dependent stress response [Paraglaciecola sp.]|jgi:predicted negative regulator of RcsB-dependent stress response
MSVQQQEEFMMEHFETEEQQIEAIKRFWKENGAAIIVGALLGLGGLWGWRYYNDQQVALKEEASATFELQSAQLNSDELAFSQAQAYIDQHSDMGYALLMAFKLAQQAIERGDLAEAAKQLAFSAGNSDNVAVKSIANLRLARVQLALDKTDEALVTIDKVLDSAFVAQQQEIKGDIYLAQKLFDKARAAYSAALEANNSNTILKMKLDNLALTANG